MEIERIDLLGVPLDIVPADSLEDCINDLLRQERAGTKPGRPGGGEGGVRTSCCSPCGIC